MSNYQINQNDTFGRLTVYEEVPQPEDAKVRGRHFRCWCSCGHWCIAPGTYLHRGKKKSCGRCTNKGRPENK